MAHLLDDVSSWWPWKTTDGVKTIGPYEACGHCETGRSWVRYGDIVTCYRCAGQRAVDEPAPKPSTTPGISVPHRVAVGGPGSSAAPPSLVALPGGRRQRRR